MTNTIYRTCARCKRRFLLGLEGIQRTRRRAYCDHCAGITRIRGYIVTDADRIQGYIQLSDNSRIEVTK